MSPLSHHCTRTHGYIAVGFLLVFSGFTLFLVCHPKNNEGFANIVVTTLATVSGPMVGAVARDCQSCCLKFASARSTPGGASCQSLPPRLQVEIGPGPSTADVRGEHRVRVHFLGLQGMNRNSGLTVMIGIEGTGSLGRTMMPSSRWRRGTMTMLV
jgi:hypothetical protein